MRSNHQHHHPSSVWADLRGVSFTQGFLDLNGVRALRLVGLARPEAEMNALISMHQHAETGKQFRAADLFFGVMLSATGAVGCLFLLWPHIKKLIIELRPAAQSTTSKAPTTKRFCREAMALC